MRRRYCKQQRADVLGQARLPVPHRQSHDEPARYASSWMTLVWWSQLPNTANHIGKGIFLTEDHSWRERKEGLKQKRSYKNKKTEWTERQLFGRDCLIISLGSRDTRRNVSDAPRQVNIWYFTHLKDWPKGNWGSLSCRDILWAASAAVCPSSLLIINL